MSPTSFSSQPQEDSQGNAVFCTSALAAHLADSVCRLLEKATWWYSFINVFKKADFKAKM